MKTCKYCRREDLHDDASKCPYCGTWLDLRRGFAPLGKLITMIFLVVFVLSLTSCVLSAGLGALIAAVFD